MESFDSLKVKEHVNFLKLLQNQENNYVFLTMAHLKTSVIYWSLTSAILLDSLDEIYPQSARIQIINYLESVYDKRTGGFAGNFDAHEAHILFTLSGIQILVILFGRGVFPDWFNLNLTVKYILMLQDESSGAFMGDEFGEIDSRFTYCAVASLSLLNRLEALDPIHQSLAIDYLQSCRNFDGGFGASPGSESHGGNIFCCISALKILGPRAEKIISTDSLLDWLVWRQLPEGGFNGRPEKLPDVCYSWWILSTLKSLNSIHRISRPALLNFILNCQDIHGEIGGFADRPGDVGDIFHTLFGLTGLALLGHEQINEEIDPLYCLPSKFL